MDLTTEIASGFLVARYHELRPELDVSSAQGEAWSHVLDAFRRRIDERFIRPIGQLVGSSQAAEKTVPGFAILALDCLLIDTIQSFREGRVSTGDVSPAKSFTSFLKRPRFICFRKDDRDEFFAYVRNALLHNGETRGAWKVRADRAEMLSKDPITGSRTLDRRLFHAAIEGELTDYCDELKNGPPELRELFLRRMDAICGIASTQGRLYFAYGSNLVEAEMLAKAPAARLDGIAFLPRYQLVFTKHSMTRHCDAATIEPCPSRVVWGFLYRVSADDEANLRKREKGYVERGVRVWRVETMASTDRGTAVDAFTLVGKERCSKSCGPTSAYLRLVVEGARARGLPDDYVATIGAAVSLTVGTDG